MQNKWLKIFLAVAGLSLVVRGGAVRADILVRSDHRLLAGKLISQNDSEVVFQLDGSDASSAVHFQRAVVSRIILTDEHGGVLPDKPASQPAAHWDIPAEPAAPPIDPQQRGTAVHPTYYLIPLHGEVGDTVVASALEQSLNDAAARKPSVVVLDINSPGGLIFEAQDIIKILHHYNKTLRIVALTDQDLSAAAILSLSVKEIYVKSTSTIGAATAFIPASGRMPAQVNEKMESAWRAVARNSAEEGGHEPLLADAMIDNDMELRLETINGKPVIKEGPGDHELCRKGKILTLTSHEAVECGLAAGMADDVDELGRDLHMVGWTECKGLGTLLEAYLPKRAAALKSQMDMLLARFQGHIDQAARDDASRTVVTITGGGGAPVMPRYYRPMPGRPYIRQPMPGPETAIITHTGPGNPLGCVVRLQEAEQDIKDAIALNEAFGEHGMADSLGDLLSKVAAARAQVYDNRPKVTLVPPHTISAAPVQPSDPPLVQPGRPTPDAPGGELPLPEHAEKTEMLGGSGGNVFAKIRSNAMPIIGFHFRLGHWNKPVISHLDPLYAGPLHLPERSASMVVAREGYVVAGILDDTDKATTVAIQVIFARYKDGHVDLTDSYKSDWVGTPDENAPQQLAGHGEIVIGIFGRQGMNLDALGLVVMPTDAEAAGGAAAGLQPLPSPPKDPMDLAVKTDLVGLTGGYEFIDSSRTAQPVVGFHYHLFHSHGVDSVRTISPDYVPFHGNPPPETLICAKDGYIVGGLLLDYDQDSGVTAFQVIFMRNANGRVDPTDSYKSDWIGRQGTHNPHQIAGNGETVIGVYGRGDAVLKSIGLVVIPAQAQAKSPAPADNGAAAKAPAAANPAGQFVKTEVIGRRSSRSFATAGSAARPVVGFHFTIGEHGPKDVIRRLDPLYSGPTDHKLVTSTKVFAREGYLVSGLMVDTDNTNVVAVQVIFARYKDGHVDEADTYKSDWIGTPDANQPTQLAGNGQTVISTFGYRETNLDGIGLVVLPAAAKDK